MTTTTPTRSAEAPRTYGNWRRPQTAGLGGLGQLATGVLFVGILSSIIASMFSGLGAALITAGIFGGILLTVSVKDKHGQSALGRTVNRVNWMRTKAKGANVYRSGPTGRAKWGTYQLPGLAAASQLTEHEDSHGRKFALVHVPSTKHYTVVIATEPDGAALVDQEQVNNQVAEYGIWLANLGDEPGIEAASVTVETAPDTGTRLRSEVEGSMDPDAPEFARAMLSEVVESYPVGSATIRVSPLVLWALGRRWWPWVLGASVALYVVGYATRVRLLPSQFEDSFPLLVWQVLFIVGLVGGFHRREIIAWFSTRAGRVALIAIISAAVVFLLFSWNNPYAPAPGDPRLGLISDNAFRGIYASLFERTYLAPGRLLNVLVLVVALYALLTAYWKPIAAAGGGFLIPLGQSTLYVFVMHVFFALIVASVPLLNRGDLLVNTVANVLVLALLWVMVRTRFLFGVVPR